MALTGLSENALQLILFGGKGGVGKTTCAVSTGLHLAREGNRVLVISTDPAHSLSDSLGQETGDDITEGMGAIGLSVLEINAQKVLMQFKEKYEKQIRKIFDTSTAFDQEDIDAVFALPIPGIDEVMGFKQIIDLIEQAQFEKFIVDTAPTGHALRLLTMPTLLDEWIKVLAKMRWKYRYMVETFSGRYNSDDGDDFLMEMKKTVKNIEKLLRDQNKCEFVAVTIPEEMAISETERLINTLNNYGIKVKQLIVNNYYESSDCEFCKQRHKEQQKYIQQIKVQFSDLKLTIVPLQPHEVRGLECLNHLGEFLCRQN
ncbi:MAG: ArsA family ATPase [Candidatus Wallbacteria bacterium]|nr:ArsA family ATPase [Candidatus Wallbacteria bacterium]